MNKKYAIVRLNTNRCKQFQKKKRDKGVLTTNMQEGVKVIYPT